MFGFQTNTRPMAIETFRNILWKARRDALFSRIIGKDNRLKCFKEIKSGLLQQKHNLGVMQITTENITGSVGRIGDFDSHFRPLKNHLRDRWVGVALRADGSGWGPIEAIKIGNDYFVIDGHHRASVARNTGIAFMDAEVWEYSHVSDNSQNQIESTQAVTQNKSVLVGNELTQKPATCICQPLTIR